MNYETFLSQKQRDLPTCGFKIDPSFLNPHLFEFQRHIVSNALEIGKYAVWAGCGLGKTLMQLEWAYRVATHTGKPVIILAPLAVAAQTINEGKKFGIEVHRHDPGSTQMIQITNYERLDHVDAGFFSGVVLDESSILKNFTGKLRNGIIEAFQATPYKLACTATPSPNDPMEIGNHAEFLDVMTRAEMLAMFFVHDGGNTSKWRIKKHAVGDFYRWVSTWAVMLSSPADLGDEYAMDGYNLPALNFTEKEIKTQKRDNGMLFNETAVSATNFNKELRITKVERLTEVVQIVDASTEPFIIWIRQNEEGDFLKKAMPYAIEVRGSDSQEKKEKHLLGFANGQFRVLITKTKIAQFGLNFQNCSNQVFASLDFSFESLYQAVRRSYRFGQKNDVNIFILTTDTMQNVIASIKKKEMMFEQMRREMICAMNSDFSKTNKMETTNKTESDSYRAYLGDCVQGIRDHVKDNSIGLSVFSPPFADLYTYSDKIEDMGNVNDYGEFVQHFQFLVKELRRVIMHGRLIAVHCMDLPIQKGKEGFIGLRDFSGILRSCFESEGFIYHSRVTIWKDPVVEMQRTKALGLLHKQLKKDSAMSRVGIPDYLMVFRDPGENLEPIENTKIPVHLWQKYASPVWMDINYTNTLQFTTARDQNDEKHICPLQLETIERAITLWSNEGDTVLSPFMGIGSEGFQALKMGRQFVGFELKESYFKVAATNLRGACEAANQQLLF
jgi:hypothetical protein